MLEQNKKKLERLHSRVIPCVSALLWVCLLIISILANDLIGNNQGCAHADTVWFFSVSLVLFCFFSEGSLCSLDMLITNWSKRVEFKFFVIYPVMFFLMAGIMLAVITFILQKSIWSTIILISMAGLLKYLNCRIPIMVEQKVKPYKGKTYKSKPI